MKIQITTDNHIDAGEKFSTYVNGIVSEAVDGLNAQITTVGVHFSDQNSSNKVAVTHDANSLDEALLGAVEKVKNSVEHTLGRLKAR
jgi:hypothetical protein